MGHTNYDTLSGLDRILHCFHAVRFRLEGLPVDINITSGLKVLVVGCGLSHRRVSDEKDDPRAGLCRRNEWKLCWQVVGS